MLTSGQRSQGGRSCHACMMPSAQGMVPVVAAGAAARSSGMWPATQAIKRSLPWRGARQRGRAPAAAASSTAPPVKVPWFDKSKEVWVELESDEDYERVLKEMPADKLLMVDLYAGWCSVCKAAYPGMVRIASTPDLLRHFVFAKANIELAAVRERIRREGVPGIPWVCIYSPAGGGAKVVGFGASFKKLGAVRANLATLTEHKGALPAGREWPLDPNGFLLSLEEVATGERALSGANGAGAPPG